MYAFICLIFEQEYIKFAFSMRYSYNVSVFQLLGPLTLAQLLFCFVSYHMFLLLALLLRTGLWRFIVAGRCPFARPATISRVVLSAVGPSDVSFGPPRRSSAFMPWGQPEIQASSKVSSIRVADLPGLSVLQRWGFIPLLA